MDALTWANYRGIITGRDAHTIAPTGTMNRAEAAAMMTRFWHVMFSGEDGGSSGGGTQPGLTLDEAVQSGLSNGEVMDMFPDVSPQEIANAVEREIVRLINIERTNRGLSPLQVDNRVHTAARIHSTDRGSDWFPPGDLCPNGSTPTDRARAAGYQGTAVQIVSDGGYTARPLVEIWMAAPDSRAHILLEGATHIGVGLYILRSQWVVKIGSPSESDAQPPQGNDRATEFEQEVLRLVNIERANHGVAPLQWHAEAAAVARAFSVDMHTRGFFSHTCPDGSTPWDRMRAAGIPFGAAAENLASGQRTPQSVVNAWMNSAGHRANILNPALTHLGVGFHNYLWTQKFTDRPQSPPVTQSIAP